MLAFAASIALLYYGRIFLITVVIAIIIAFLLDPIVTMFVKLRLPRAVASFVVCSIALLALYLFGFGLYTQFSGFVEELPVYSQRMNEMVDNVATRDGQHGEANVSDGGSQAIPGAAASACHVRRPRGGGSPPSRSHRSRPRFPKFGFMPSRRRC